MHNVLNRFYVFHSFGLRVLARKEYSLSVAVRQVSFTQTKVVTWLINSDEKQVLFNMEKVSHSLFPFLIGLRFFWGKYHMRPACHWFGYIQIDRNTHILIWWVEDSHRQGEGSFYEYMVPKDPMKHHYFGFGCIFNI